MKKRLTVAVLLVIMLVMALAPLAYAAKPEPQEDIPRIFSITTPLY